MDVLEAYRRVQALSGELEMSQHEPLSEPYLTDIEAFGKASLALLAAGDIAGAIGGLQSLFLYGYLRGRTDAQKADQP